MTIADRAAEALPPTLGKYRLGRPVGSGPTGVVYSARDEALQKPAAVKVPAWPADASTGAVEQFLGETRRVARLEHRNIVRLYDADVDGGILYIATELLTGGDGQTFLRTQRPLARTLDVFAQIFEGLAYAHRSGVVHGALKPDSIVFSSEAVPKLVDFGLEQLLAAASGHPRVLSEESARYLSPEQASDPGICDARSDLFSAGAVLFEALTGRAPFRGATLIETLGRIADDPVPDPKAFRPDLPPDLSDAIRRCLEKDPSRRPSSGDAVALALRWILDRLQASTPPLTAEAVPPPPFEPPPAGTRAESTAPPEEEPLLEKYDLGDGGEPGEASLPARPPAGAAGGSSRRLALVGSAVVLLLLVAGAIALFRRAPSAVGAPLQPKPAPLSPLVVPRQGDEGAAQPASAVPTLNALSPARGVRQVALARGETFVFKVEAAGGAATVAPVWRRNDEVVARGPEWAFRADATGLELVTVSYGDEHAVTLVWYVKVH